MIVTTPEARRAGLRDYPFAPNHFAGAGLRIHYVDEGDGPPVVLFHGEPTWSFLNRHVIPPLVASGFRAIAPDYSGDPTDQPSRTGVA